MCPVLFLFPSQTMRIILFTTQIINHVINVEDMRHPDQKKTSCYDIDVEVDDTLKAQMNSFLLSTASQQVELLLQSYFLMNPKTNVIFVRMGTKVMNWRTRRSRSIFTDPRPAPVVKECHFEFTVYFLERLSLPSFFTLHYECIFNRKFSLWTTRFTRLWRQSTR